MADLGLSGDGTKSIVFGTTQGDLWVVRKAPSGNWGAAPNFPVHVGTYIASSPAVGDVTGDGIPEIIVGHGSPATLGPGGVKAFRRDGILLWSRDSQDGVEGPDGQPDPVLGSPAIGDIDGDGQAEVVWGSLDFRLYVVTGATGVNEAGWPKQLNDVIRSSPALHDLDGDGKLEIVVAHASNVNPPDPPGGCIRVFHPDGTMLAGFPRCIDQVISSSPSIGDIDGDGEPEIVHGTGTFYPSAAERIYAWNCDGTAVAGWPVAIHGQSSTSPALANLDTDPELEVVATADNTRSSSTFHVYAFEGNGTQIFEAVPNHFFGAPKSVGEPVVADVLGNDGAPEIIVPASSSAVVFSTDGTLLTDDGSHPLGVPAFYVGGPISQVGVADFEDDASKIEVVAVAAPVVGGAQSDDLTVKVWNPVQRSVVPPWGFFRHDAARLGVAPGTPSCDGPCRLDAFGLDFFTLSPCRLVDTRGTGGTIGGPALGAGETRDLPVTGECGIPAGARALAINVTVTQPSGTGFLRFSPGGCQPPIASTINFTAGATRANNAVVSLAKDGTGVLRVNAVVQDGGQVHLILDVVGYFQ